MFKLGFTPSPAIPMIDRLPEELLLQSFEYLSFNDLRGVLATSVRWRALGSQCHAFWADIQTPRDYFGPKSHGAVPAKVELAARRIICTNGRRFKLRLRITHPAILRALASHIHNIELLDAYLINLDDLGAFITFIRTVSAPHLRSLTIHVAERANPCFVLPGDLFTGAVCPNLMQLSLRNVVQLAPDPLPCFLSVTDLRLSHEIDFFSSVSPDIFAQFPSLRSLILGARFTNGIFGFNAAQREIVHRFQTADYSRLTYVELRRDCWSLAYETSWPLEPVPHVLADHPCTSLPFLEPGRLQRGHIVFEPQPNECCIVRVGSDDWSFSRAGVAETWHPDTGARDGLDDIESAPYLEFHIDDELADEIGSATVPADMLARARFVLDEVPGIAELRLVVGRESALPRMGRFHHLSFRKLRTLVLRGGFDSDARARVDCASLVKFAASDFDPVEFPISLRLENVQLCGELPARFPTYFSDIQTQDAKAWSYLSVRDELNSKHG